MGRRHSIMATARRMVKAGATDDQLREAFRDLHGVTNPKHLSTYPQWYRGKIEKELELERLRAQQDAVDVASTVDQATVERLVAQRVDARLDELRKAAEAAAKPQVIEVKRGKKTVAKVEGGHYLLPRLIKLVAAGFNVYLWGPAGTGKTTAARMAFKALGRESALDTLDPSTFRSMIQGYQTPKGAPVHTTFTRCWTEGHGYIADELDNGPGNVQTLFNSALANGHAPLAWGNVERPETFGFIGTGNTPGRPTRSFPDRRPMSQAFADRLYFFYFPLDEAIECRAAGLPVPVRPPRRRTTCTPQAWVTFVQRLRAWAEDNAPTMQVTPRASLDGMRALELGENPAEVADGLIFRGCDEELKRKALSAVRWEETAVEEVAS